MTIVAEHLIEHLDWNHDINCSSRDCHHEGVALVKFRYHEGCQSHRLWYVACQTHLDLATTYKTRCTTCGFHLSLLTHKFL